MSEEEAKDLTVTDEQETSEPKNMLAIIESAAINPDVDVHKMSALLDMQERIMDKQAEAAFNQDLMDMQVKMPIINRNGIVEYPVDKNKPDGEKKEAFRFASYDVIYKEIKPLLDEYGFCVSFTSEAKEGGGATIIGTLLHRQGHKRDAAIPVALDTSGGKNNVQAMGCSL